MVKFELNHALIGEVAKVEGDGRIHAVDHEAGVEVVAEEGAVGQNELAAVLHREGRAGCHGHVGVYRQGATGGDHHMPVHVAVIGPRFRTRDRGCASVAGRLGSSEW